MIVARRLRSCTALRGILLVLGLALASASTANADWLYVSAEGLDHVEEIREAIAPATLFEAAPGAPGAWYARGIIREVIGPATPARAAGPPQAMSYEEFLRRRAAGASFGSGVARDSRIRFVAVGADGTVALTTVDLLAHWFVVVHEFDSTRDIRAAIGNFDEAYGIPINSPAYSAAFLLALGEDVAAALGVSPSLTARGGVDPGTLTRRLQWSRVPEGPARQRLGQQHQARLDERLRRQGMPDHDWSTPAWTLEIARARRYGFERGLVAQAALAVVRAVLQLGTLEPGRFGPLYRANPEFDDLTTWASVVMNQLLLDADVRPGRAVARHDGLDVVELVAWADRTLLSVDGVADPAARAAVMAEYDQRRASLAPSPARDHRTAGVARDPQLPVDPSETALVALELLQSTNAACFVHDDLLSRVANLALGHAYQPGGPDPRAGDRVSLRSASQRLLERLLQPPKDLTGRAANACARAAGVVRRVVIGAATSGNVGVRRFAIDVLRATGWGSDRDLGTLLTGATCCAALQYVQAGRAPEPADLTDRLRARTRRLALREHVRLDVMLLSALLDLRSSAQAHLRSAAANVERWMAEVPTRGDAGERFLRDELTAFRSSPAR